MEVDIRYRLSLTRQLRLVEVRYVVVAAVEYIEQCCTELDVVREVVAGFHIDERGRLRPDAVVLDQRRRAEMPQARAAEPAARMVDREPQRRDALDRAGNAIARRIALREARARPGEIGIDDEPRDRI